MPGEFKGWSHGSIIHHKAAGSVPPGASSDHCRVRLIRKRECFLSSNSLTKKTDFVHTACLLKTESGWSREAHAKKKKRAQTFPTRVKKKRKRKKKDTQYLLFEMDSVPPFDHCVVHSSGSVSSVRGVFPAVTNTEPWRFNHCAHKNQQSEFRWRDRAEISTRRTALF